MNDSRFSGRNISALKLTLLATAASAFIAAPAWAAQDGESADGADSNIIIVTAQKREQDIQDVPISISVVSGEAIDDYGIQDLKELDRYVPNLYVQETPGNNAIYIRGIGSTPGNLAFEQTVGLFVDGVYGGHARQFQAPFFDIERVEILRGPQGALVGKNTSAGAISIVSAKPTDELYINVQGGYEFDIGGERVSAVVSGPLTDNLGVRIGAQYENSDGYIDNLTLGGKDGGRESLFGRAIFDLDTGDGVDLSLKIEAGKVDLDGNAVERIVTAQDPDLERSTSGFPGGVLGRDFDDTDTFNAVITTNIEIGDHVLTGITGYSSYDYAKLLDSDFGPAPLFASGFAEGFDQLSQEIRITSPSGKALEYIVGGYFHTNDYDLDQITFIDFGPFDGVSTRSFKQENTAWSFFGSATYNFREALRLSGSLRYTIDKKTANQTRTLTGVVIPTWLATPLSGRRNEKDFDPSVNIQWDATPDIMLYASYGQGSKAGGFIGGQAATPQSQFEIESESAETFEIGAKMALFDRSVLFNIAGFHTDFKDLQVSSFDAVSNGFITTNAGKARSKGIEADVTIFPADGITINGAFAYLDAEYIDFPGAPCPFTNPGCNVAMNNSAGNVLPRSPKWSGSLAVDIAQPVSDNIEFLLNGAMSFRSRAFLDESFNPTATQSSYAKFDARIGLRAPDKKWELALVGKNLTNEITSSHAFNTPLAPPGSITKYVQRPRTIAVQASFTY